MNRFKRGIIVLAHNFTRRADRAALGGPPAPGHGCPSLELGPGRATVRAHIPGLAAGFILAGLLEVIVGILYQVHVLKIGQVILLTMLALDPDLPQLAFFDLLVGQIAGVFGAGDIDLFGNRLIGTHTVVELFNGIRVVLQYFLPLTDLIAKHIPARII